MPKRVCYHVSREAAAAMIRVRMRSRFQNDSDAFRVAIHLFDHLLHLSSHNSRIFITDEAGLTTLYSPHLQYEAPTRKKESCDPIQATPERDYKRAIFLADEVPQLVARIKDQTLVTSTADVLTVAAIILDEMTGAMASGHVMNVVCADGTRSCFNPFSPQKASPGNARLDGPSSTRPARPARRVSDAQRAEP